MKKTYFAPNMETIEVETQQMLAASPLGFGDPVNSATGAEAPALDIPASAFDI